MKSLLSYRDNITYIHHKTLSRHVGDANSIHSWCKKSMCPDATLNTPSNLESTSSTQQNRVDEMMIGNLFDYYKKLFTTVLTIAEEELSFLKLKPLMLMQIKNRLKLGTTDKLNEMTCAEMVDVLSDVIIGFIKKAIESAHYLALSADASEAKKTSEEKELVYGKVVTKGDRGFVPLTFLLKCQSLKDFGGADGEGTFKAMLNAIELYIDRETLTKMLVCLTTDGAAVNFGRVKGALTRMLELLEWDALKFHCFNHNLELGIKDSYRVESSFENIQSTLITLFYLFKNSGKSWRLFRVVGETLGLNVLRYTKVHGTRFQAHIHRGLSNFIRNFLPFLLFTENAEEQGKGKDGIVTRKLYPKIVGFRKDWTKYSTIAIANLFFKVLSETSKLALIMETDSVLIYQLLDAIHDASSNLNDLISDKDEPLPTNIDIITEQPEKDSMIVKVSAASATL